MGRSVLNFPPADPPPVTFIMAARNAEGTIGRAISSALNQEYDAAVRVIVVDDGSTDGTAQAASHFDSRVLIKRFAESRGRSAARNAALALVDTPLVAIHDADDFSLPGRLAATIQLVDDHHGVVGGGIRLVTPRGAIWGTPAWPTNEDAISGLLLAGVTPIAHPTMVVRTDLLRSVGGYSDSIPFAEDLDLMLRLGQHTRFAATDVPVLIYTRSRTDSLRYLWNTELWRRRVVAGGPNPEAAPRTTVPGAMVTVAAQWLRQAARLMLRWGYS